mgnify:CR=1 FL=1
MVGALPGEAEGITYRCGRQSCVTRRGVGGGIMTAVVSLATESLILISTRGDSLRLHRDMAAH